MSDLKLETYGKEIVQVTSSKFLGVYTDQHLTWVERISHISRKIVKISAYCHDSVTLQGLYNSLIFSYLSYRTAAFLGVVIIPLVSDILVYKIILVLVFIQFWVNNFYFSFSFSFEIILVSISVLVSVFK